MAQADDSDLKRFAELVAARGARPGVWPEAERAWALAFLRTSPDAQRLAEEAAEMDAWLDAVAVPDRSPALEERILAGAPAFARPVAEAETGMHPAAYGLRAILRRRLGRLGDQPLWAPVFRPVYAAACAALFGLLLGWGGVFSQGAAGDEEEILALAFVGSELESYDLGELQ